MAKAKSDKSEDKVNKSQAVRDFFAKNPDAMPKDVVDALKAQGIDVSAQVVSTIKYQLKTNGGAVKAKRIGKRKKKRVVRAARAAKSAAPGLTVADLKAAKALAVKLGGAEKVRQALSVLDDLR